jgi:hypothetical protein
VIPYFTIAFLVLAGMFKAVADTLTHHYDTSVFKMKDRKFWDPSISWSYAKYFPLTKYKIDAWHLANSGMILCWCAALATVYTVYVRYPWWAIFIGAGLVFNLSFNLFYNKIFR